MSVDWNSIAAGCMLTAVVHPFTYVKVLTQLGYEPLYPTVRKNLFLKKQLQYPPVTSYLKYLRQRNGFFGLYKGVAPRVCANATTSITYSLVSLVISNNQNDFIVDPESVFNDQFDVLQFSTLCSHNLKCQENIAKILNVKIEASKETLSRCLAIIASQPFHVISIRCMAQCIGEETSYNSIYNSFLLIYKEEGIFGFFRGLIPRMACELMSLWMCNILSYFMDKYLFNEPPEVRDLRDYNRLLVSYFAQTVTYPLSVVSTVMAVNGSKLRAGSPPFTPIYNNWVTCLTTLHKQGLSNRGSSFFFRKVLDHAVTAGSVYPKSPSRSF